MTSANEYDRWHRHEAQKEQATEEHLYPWHKTALRLLPNLNNKDVLELGCGRGDFAIVLAEKYRQARIKAVDFSESAIEIAREKARRSSCDVQFEVGDATNLRFSDASFDYVISCECLEHVPKPSKMTKELARVLRPNGAFLLTTENYFNGMLLAWAKCLLTRAAFESGSGVQSHENFFLYWHVKRLLQAAGLHIEHMESNHFQWLLLPRVAPSRLCTEQFTRAFWNRLFRPFGRHFTYVGTRVA